MKKIILITIISSIFVMNCVGKKYIPREIAFDEINISNIPKKSICKRTFEMPENKEYEKALNEALTIADNELSIAQYMINNGLVKKSYWNKAYTGSVIIKDPKIIYGFTLGVKDDKIINFGEVTKYVYKDKISTKDLSKRERILSIHNFDNTNIAKAFIYGNVE